MLLLDQNRARWDRVLDPPRARGARARRASSAAPRGPYALQAAIAACHARARDRRGDRLAADRRALRARWRSVAPSPIVELNRAVAVAMAFGPAAGLALVDALRRRAGARRVSPAAGVRGDLLAKLGRLDEARAEFQRAAELTRNERERDVLLARAAMSAVSRW